MTSGLKGQEGMKCLARAFRIPDGPWCCGDQSLSLGSEALMPPLAARVSCPPPHMQPTPCTWTLLNFPGWECALRGERRGSGTVLPCQPSQPGSPSELPGRDLPAFDILLHYISSHEPRQQEFSAANQPQQEMIPGSYCFLNSWKQQGGARAWFPHECLHHSVERLVDQTAQGPRLGGHCLSTILQGCNSHATKPDSWLWKFNV